MVKHINFSEAIPLVKMYNKNKLLEDYNYIGSREYSQFEKIKNNFHINKVVKINNPELWGMYLLCKEEYKAHEKGTNVKELILYHVTSPSNAEKIAKNNIDWRMTRRSRYGIGSCFSPVPIYANTHASSRGAIIIFKVLVRQIEPTEINYHLEVPINISCDTTTGNEERVYVKYDDYNFYPTFIVYC